MTAPTPEQIKAALDELAPWKQRHRIDFIAFGDQVQLVRSDNPDAGLGASPDRFGDWTLHDFRFGEVQSLDPKTASNHERMQILGARSPDLGRMLRDAYMASAYSNYRSWGDGYALDQEPEEVVREIEEEATEYAARIMGGQR